MKISLSIIFSNLVLIVSPIIADIFSFIQAIMEGTRANYILMQAPFLIPFTSRVKIFTVSGYWDMYI